MYNDDYSDYYNDDELYRIEEILDLETVGNTTAIDDEIMAEFERIDEVLTMCVNHYRAVAGAFYLSTDEIMEMKDKIFSGKMFDYQFDMKMSTMERKIELLNYLKTRCDFNESSKRAYELVEPFMRKACLRLGLAEKSEMLGFVPVMCDDKYEYAFDECGVYSGTILRFMTSREIQNWVGYVSKSAATNISLKNKYYLSDNRKAMECSLIKRRYSMPVWYGRTPVGDVAIEYKRIHAYEQVMKQSESGEGW